MQVSQWLMLLLYDVAPALRGKFCCPMGFCIPICPLWPTLTAAAFSIDSIMADLTFDNLLAVHCLLEPEF